MSVKTLEIDGRMVTGVAGETIFSVAWDNGIRIPRLCHVGGVSDVGACRLCLVEVEGQSKLMASCMTQIEEGMVVRTNTDKLRAHRRLIVELLFAERNHVCSVCVMNGNCRIWRRNWVSTTCGSATSSRSWPWTPVTRNSAWTTTGVSCAPAASASAMRWKALIPGTSPAAGPSRLSSLMWEGPLGELHQLRQVRPGLPHGRAVYQG